MPLPLWDQHRPVTGHACGRRPVGTGWNIRSTLRVGYSRALAQTVSLRGLEKRLAPFGFKLLSYNPITALIARLESMNAEFRGLVWSLESLPRAVARFNDVGQHHFGNPEVVATWIALRGNVVCTCIRSTEYESTLIGGRVTVPNAKCGHAADFAAEIDALAALLPTTQHSAAVEAEVKVEVFDTGRLPLAVVVSGAGMYREPAPFKCQRKATSLCNCVSAGASFCSHVTQTRQLCRNDTAAGSGGANGSKRSMDAFCVI